MQGTFYSAADSLAVAAVVNPEDYGVDWDGPVPVDHEAEMDGVHMPTDVDPPISPVDLQELRRTVDPLADSDCFGIDLYVATAEFVAHKLLG